MIRYTVYFSTVSDYKNLICLWDSYSSEKELAIYEPKLELEEGAAGTFEFNIPPTHPYYNMMQPRQTLITIHRNDEWLWEGQVMDIEDNFYKERNVYCEGALAYLNDTIQMADEYRFTTESQYIQQLLNRHNTNVEMYAPYKVIKPGYVMPLQNFPETMITGYDNTMKYISDFLDTYGGHLYLQKNRDGELTLGIYKDYLNTSSQSINFGVNLLDYTAKKEMPDFCTVVIPLGATIEDEEESTDPDREKPEKRVTVEEANKGVPYVTMSDEVLEKYGWIEQTLDLNEIDNPEELLEEAKKYLSTVSIDNLSLEVTALDMAYLKRESEA